MTTIVSGCGFDTRYSHENLKYYTCFKQGVPWYLGNCGV